MRRHAIRWGTALAALAGLVVGVASAARADTTLTFWSHWSDEPTKIAFVEQAAHNLEAKHPGVHVKLTWYQKEPLYGALDAALRARKGPDVFYIDADRVEYIGAGMVAPLDDLVNWNNIYDWARAAWTINGKTYAFPLEASTVELYYNVTLMHQLGGDPGPDQQFSEAGFLDLVKRAREAGITPIVQGVADRPYPGAYVIQEEILKSLGKTDYARLLKGEISWKDPRVARAFDYVQQLIDAKVYPASLTSLKLGESHYYFYTKPGGLMLPMGSWYTSRAFRSPDQGGQPADFQLGIMNFPALDGAACNDCKTLAIGGSFAINAQSPNKKLAGEFLDEMATPEMGDRWLSTVLTQTGVKSDPSKIEGPHKAYFNELLALDAKNVFFIGDMNSLLHGGCREAYTQVLNVAFPAGLIRAPEAEAKMDQACGKG